MRIPFPLSPVSEGKGEVDHSSVVFYPPATTSRHFLAIVVLLAGGGMACVLLHSTSQPFLAMKEVCRCLN
jgi:hypothetical protein